MPRKQRIQFPGAVYHVISRGNYRKELFLSENTGKAFERALFETVERCGWKLHAYVIMSNHYHLAVETPEPNLVDGMKWLQSTFATRFNRLRGERGHVFQGRYKSILIGEDRPLLGLIDYIHLNPVRAGICAVEGLKSYALSSYPKYFKRSPMDALHREDFPGTLDLPDSLAGMNRYAKHLALSEVQDSKQKEALMKQYCRGWFIGSKETKKALAKDIAKQHPGIDWEGADLQELNESKWELLVAHELKHAGKTKTNIANEPKGATWKIKIAKTLRKQTTAKNSWIAQRLNMGHPSRVSNLIQNKT
ncbi:MAG: transposase [Opitutaceae bacterium]